MNQITLTRLKEVINYCPETGVFYWKIQTCGRICVGDVAGSKGVLGYVRIKIDGKQYMAHRLAWLYVYGKWPDAYIDHRDHNKANNRIANLRDFDKSENAQNQIQAQSHNKLGLLGVHRHRNKFQALISVGGKQKNLGMFDTPEEAHTAYVSAKREFHIGCMI